MIDPQIDGGFSDGWQDPRDLLSGPPRDLGADAQAGLVDREYRSPIRDAELPPDYGPDFTASPAYVPPASDVSEAWRDAQPIPDQTEEGYRSQPFPLQDIYGPLANAYRRGGDQSNAVGDMDVFDPARQPSPRRNPYQDYRRGERDVAAPYRGLYERGMPQIDPRMTEGEPPVGVLDEALETAFVRPSQWLFNNVVEPIAGGFGLGMQYGVQGIASSPIGSVLRPLIGDLGAGQGYQSLQWAGEERDRLMREAGIDPASPNPVDWLRIAQIDGQVAGEVWRSVAVFGEGESERTGLSEPFPGAKGFVEFANPAWWRLIGAGALLGRGVGMLPGGARLGGFVETYVANAGMPYADKIIGAAFRQGMNAAKGIAPRLSAGVSRLPTGAQRFLLEETGELRLGGLPERFPEGPGLRSRVSTIARGITKPSDVYEMNYKLVELDDLIASHFPNGSPNPAYPSDVQPRARDRIASLQQVKDIAQTLDPDSLLDDVKAIDRGTPIVRPDNVVESGNGRTMALALARESGGYARYQTRLAARSAEFGFTPDQVIGMRNPVLVRVRKSAVPSAEFAAEANGRVTLAMSTAEQAVQDSSRLSDDILASLQVGEEQTLEQALRSPKNAHVRTAFAATVPKNERAALADEGGQQGQAFYGRLRAALFAKAYPTEAGQNLLRLFTESADPVVKNVENAMFGALPYSVQAESLIRAGFREADLSLADDLATAVEEFIKIKQSGGDVAAELAQRNSPALFGEIATDATQNTLLALIARTSRAPKPLREFLITYAKGVVDAPPAGQGTLMGRGINKDDLIQRAKGKKVPAKTVESVTPAEPTTPATTTPTAGIAVSQESRIEAAHTALNPNRKGSVGDTLRRELRDRPETTPEMVAQNPEYRGWFEEALRASRNEVNDENILSLAKRAVAYQTERNSHILARQAAVHVVAEGAPETMNERARLRLVIKEAAETLGMEKVDRPSTGDMLFTEGTVVQGRPGQIRLDEQVERAVEVQDGVQKFIDDILNAKYRMGDVTPEGPTLEELRPQDPRLRFGAQKGQLTLDAPPPTPPTGGPPAPPTMPPGGLPPVRPTRPSIGQRAKDAFGTFIELFQGTRGLVAGGDLSNVGRQMFPFLFSHPISYAKGIGTQFRSIGSDRDTFVRAQEALGEMFERGTGLSRDELMTEVGGNIIRGEAVYAGVREVNDLPVVGTILRKTKWGPFLERGEQGYVGALNATRVHSALGSVKMYERMLGRSLDLTETQKIVKDIRVMSGRGFVFPEHGKAPETVVAVAKLANGLGFSPQFAVARARLIYEVPKAVLSAATHAATGKPIPIDDVEQIRLGLGYLASVGTIWLIAKQAGLNIELNMGDSEFGKVDLGPVGQAPVTFIGPAQHLGFSIQTYGKKGQERNYLDPGQGVGQDLRLLYRTLSPLIPGSDLRDGKGKKWNPWAAKFGQQDMMDVLISFTENKLAPSPGKVVEGLRGEVDWGDPTSNPITSLLIPLWLQGTLEATGAAKKARLENIWMLPQWVRDATQPPPQPTPQPSAAPAGGGPSFRRRTSP